MMNVKHSGMFAGKQTSNLRRSMVSAGEGDKECGNTERGNKGMFRGPCCKCHLVPFNTSWNVAVDIQDAAAAVSS